MTTNVMLYTYIIQIFSLNNVRKRTENDGFVRKRAKRIAYDLDVKVLEQ